MAITQNITTQKPPVAGPVLAVIMVIIVEMMFFGGLVSAYVLAQAGKVEWPPASQPRLPFAISFGNMLVLLASAVTMWLFFKSLRKKENDKYLTMTILLGLLFFLVQGYEWARILIFGIQTPHSLFGSFFYTLIGAHGFHVFVGLILLTWLWHYQKKHQQNDQFKAYAAATGLFWFFVVALWPVLYSLIYVN